jgi:hypothetical protein
MLTRVCRLVQPWGWKRPPTYVAKGSLCASACAIAWLGGAKRGAPSSRHPPQFSVSTLSVRRKLSSPNRIDNESGLSAMHGGCEVLVPCVLTISTLFHQLRPLMTRLPGTALSSTRTIDHQNGRSMNREQGMKRIDMLAPLLTLPIDISNWLCFGGHMPVR